MKLTGNTFYQNLIKEYLPTKIWALSGNIFPFFFAIGIALLAAAGQLLNSVNSILLWSSRGFKF